MNQKKIDDLKIIIAGRWANLINKISDKPEANILPQPGPGYLSRLEIEKLMEGVDFLPDVRSMSAAEIIRELRSYGPDPETEQMIQNYIEAKKHKP
jgi:hypothetical protein